MPDYVGLQATAQRLIAEAGKLTTVRHRNGDVYDPITGEMVRGGFLTQPVNAVFLPARQGPTDRYKGATMDRAKIVELIIGTVGLTYPLEAASEISAGGQYLSIRALTHIRPDDGISVVAMGWAELL